MVDRETVDALPVIDLDPCEAGTTCSGCGELAAGLAKNLDREPSCRPCEAERLALIVLICEAAGAEAPPGPAQSDISRVKP